MNNEQMKELLKLIADEIEAIEGYKEAMKLFKDKEDIVEELGRIMDDEVEHKAKLASLLYHLD